MMTLALPKASFMDMHARHGFGDDMSNLAAYGAVVGSRAAQAQNASVKGFVGTSQQLTAVYFGEGGAMGTTPHALIGYAGGDIVRAMDMFATACPDQKAMIALVDYNGREVTDSLRAAEWYKERRQREGWTDKFFGVRLDTHGGRFAEGLDYETSVQILERWTGVKGEYNIVAHVLGEHAFNMDTENQLVDKVRKVLFGKGVSAANIINVRNELDKAGHYGALVVASSGFDPFKCEVMGAIDAPINMVGTGSFLPKTLSETFATADVISYDGVPRVKVGREYLLEDKE
jgi:nicotinate phosphoribosyltransferase